MDYEAVAHGCGWKATTRQEIVVAEKDDRVPVEVARGHIEKIREKLKMPPKSVAVEKQKFPKPPMLSDVGHGTTCTCEVCWQMRVLEVFPGAAVRESPRTVPEVPEAATPGSVSPSEVAPPVAVPVEPKMISKLDLLKKLFPL